jgi:hypothetical protein
MSGLDVFAWIVLLILVASIVGVFCIKLAKLIPVPAPQPA